jgi:predicted amidohydrolase YtcJ
MVFRCNVLTKQLVAAISLAGLLYASSPVSGVERITADTLFINGQVYTVNPQQPWAEAVAVSDGGILFVGDTSNALRHQGDATRVIDLKGKMLLPGFVSGHEHLIASLWMNSGVSLFAAKSKEDYLRIIGEYAAKNPHEAIIRGYGWNIAAYGGEPTAADLDQVVADRPVMLLDTTIHDIWMNSKAMEAGGVDRSTPDAIPGFSFWVRDENGDPTGVGKETVWMDAYVKSGAWQAESMITSSQETLYSLAAAAGYTSVINQGLVTPNIKNLKRYYEDYKFTLEHMHKLEKSDRLQMRTFLQFFFKSPDTSTEKLLGHAADLRKRYNSDQLRLSGIKVHPEGVYLGKTSLLLVPYSDDPGNRGARGLSPQQVERMILAGNKAGFDVSVHTDGSATVRATIDSFLRARQAGYTDARNSLQHFSLVHPDDMQRVIQHRIPVNMTPLWSTTWGDGLQLSLEIIGEERTTGYFQQIRTAVEAGVPVSIGADVPSSPPDLMGALTQCEAAITRRHPIEPAEIFPPKSQALSLEQCLYVTTMGGAYQARMEKRIGSIEPGKYADLVVVEKNLFEVPVDQIAETAVLATMMNGRFTHNTGL